MISSDKPNDNKPNYDNPDWYAQLKKSPLNPPSWVFGVVWPILYLTLAWSFLRHVQRRPIGNFAWVVFMIQIFINVVWSTIFFTWKNPSLALYCIFAMILLTAWSIYLFWFVDPLSAYILIPYLGWLCFASYLNVYIVWNNNVQNN